MLSIEQLKILFPDWEQGLYESVLENAELKEANAGSDQLLADLQGIGLGGTAGAIGHRGEQRLQLLQFLGRREESRPLLLFFGRKKFQGNKRTLVLDQLRNLHPRTPCSINCHNAKGLGARRECHPIRAPLCP